MTSGVLRLIAKRQRGSTLIDLAIAMGVGALISGAITMTTFQVFTTNAQSTAHMTAVKQVESAIHQVSRDVRMAQTVEPGEDSGFPLKLTWVEWNDTANEVTYSVENGNLRRSHSVDGSEPTDTIVAQHIDSSSEMTSAQLSDSVLTLKITAVVTGFRSASETRVVEVVPEPSA